MFYNNLPYGDTDDFNERVKWDDVWTKDSYRLLTRIFMENNSIMTKAYVLMAIKPELDKDTQHMSATKQDQSLFSKSHEPSASFIAKTEQVTSTECAGFDEPDEEKLSDSTNDVNSTDLELRNRNSFQPED